MPLAGRREITVYDRVVVGSDGSASALYAVARAHEVASAAEARVVVVSAYDPDDAARPHQPVDGRRLLHGREAARAAVTASVREITSERVRDIGQVVDRPRPCTRRSDMGDVALIIAGVDGSEESRAALQLAYDEATHHGASLTVVMTWHPPTLPQSPPYGALTETAARPRC